MRFLINILNIRDIVYVLAIDVFASILLSISDIIKGKNNLSLTSLKILTTLELPKFKLKNQKILIN